MTAIFTNRWVHAGLAVAAMIVGVLVYNQGDTDSVASTEAANTPVTTAASPDNTVDAAGAETTEASLETVETTTGETANATGTTEATE